MIRKVFKTNILIVYYPSVAPKKYFAKNLELCEPKNLLFRTALTVTKLLKKIHQTAVSSKLMKATKKVLLLMAGPLVLVSEYIITWC